MERLNKIIIKYIGWILYPTSKQGKEDYNITIKEKYGK